MMIVSSIRRQRDSRVTARDSLPHVEGWEGATTDNFPMTREFDSLLDNDTRKIRDLCIVDNYAVKYDSCLYIFIPSTMSWHYARGSLASRHLCVLLEMKNVTVSYAIAAMPYIDYAEKIARTVEHLPQSVCVSSWRQRFFMVNGVLNFKTMTNVVECSSKQPITQRIGGFPVSPVTSEVLFGNTIYTGETLVQQVLSRVLDEDSMMTLMWTVGNGMIDPIKEPRILYFYGRGGDGKSTTIDILQKVLDGAFTPLSQDYVSIDKPLSPDDLSRAASSRFIVSGDVNLKFGHLNTKLWKMITGGDSFASVIGTVKLKCTGFFASNDLWFDNKKIQDKWFTRRTVVLSMKKLEVGAEKPPNSISHFDRSRFLAECVYLRCTLPYMPVSIRDALITIFGRAAERATRGVILQATDDFEDAYAATISISIASLMDYDKLIELVQAMSLTLIIVDSMKRKALRGVILREEYDNPEMHNYKLVIKEKHSIEDYIRRKKSNRDKDEDSNYINDVDSDYVGSEDEDDQVADNVEDSSAEDGDYIDEVVTDSDND